MSSPKLKFSLKLCKLNCEKFLKITKSILRDKNVKVFYALKTNTYSEIRKLIYSCGLGAEIITDNELESALKQNIPIVVNGHYKSDNIIEKSIINKVEMINVESFNELLRINNKAKELHIDKVNVGIRVKIDDNRIIGFDKEDLSKISAETISNCHLHGLHFHAGWNIKDDNIIKGILEEIKDYLSILTNIGFNIDTINFGGSFCEPTENGGQLPNRIKIYKEFLPNTIKNVHFEPGRYIVGNCGNLEAEIVEVRKNCFCINSCAYGYLLINATKNVSIVPRKFTTQTYPKKIVLSGHWPCEEDKIEINDFEYNPQIGDRIIFHNFGAYCDEWRLQFDYNNGLDYSFDTNYYKISSSLEQEEISVLDNNWNFLQDRFENYPSKLSQKKILLKGILNLFDRTKKYTEQEVNTILWEIHSDFCLIRRELFEEGLIKRENNIYYF